MSRAWVIFKRIGRLLKFLLFCVILTVIILLLWRVFSTGTPKEIQGLEPNDKLNAAYSASLSEDKELYVFKQIHDELSGGETKGYFGVPEARFIPDANQAQIVFRYNNSTISALAKDYSLPAVPSKTDELFDVSLVLYIGDRPEDPSQEISKDNAENIKAIRVTPEAEPQKAYSTLYSFYRYTFNFENGEEAINLNELMESKKLLSVHVEIYYKGDLDYSKNAYGALSIYDYRRDNIAVKLTKNEKEALGGK